MQFVVFYFTHTTITTEYKCTKIRDKKTDIVYYVPIAENVHADCKSVYDSKVATKVH